MGILGRDAVIDLDIGYLKERFRYDAESGILYWKRASKRWQGKPVGSVHRCGMNGAKKYLRCTLDGVSIYIHRIAWAIEKGEQPVNIDHIDGDGLNNRIENLRSVAHDVNTKNQKLHSTNTSGYAGVTYRKESGRWRARIMVNDKPISLGTFKTIQEAVSARDAANKDHGFHANHGSLQ